MQTCRESTIPKTDSKGKQETPNTQILHSFNRLGDLSRSCLLGSWDLSLSISGSVQRPLLWHSAELLLCLSELLGLLISHAGQERLLLLSVQVVVVGTDDRVGVIKRNLADIGYGLDLGCALLVLRISHLESKLLSTRLDSIPASKSAGKVDVTGHAEVLRVDDLVSRGVVQNGLGVDTSLVSEGAETGDVVVEGDVDLDKIGNKILNLLELLEVVLAHDVVTVRNDHTGHETTKGRDTVALTDTKNGSINVSGTSLESAVCVRNGTTRVVVEVGLDVTRDDTTKCADEVVNLARRSATNGISDTDTVDTDLVDGAVDGEQVNEVRAERVLGRETDLLALALDELNDFESGVLDVCHVLAVAVLAEVARGSNNNIESIDTGLDSDPGIVHVASYVGKDLGLELLGSQKLIDGNLIGDGTYTKLADGLAVLS